MKLCISTNKSMWAQLSYSGASLMQALWYLPLYTGISMYITKIHDQLVNYCSNQLMLMQLVGKQEAAIIIEFE